ncbi:hypothetical protein [Nocardia sp. NPDC050406]|uniref:hypothetical protein n=1 Tax=Nocardia sp. NPDC050406 TaxID=3364318 RepID=UPI0037B09A97
MTDSFKADIDQLNRLGSTVKTLAGQVGALRCGKGAVEPFNSGKPGGVLTSHEAAVALTKDLVHGALVASAKTRLEGVADAMAYTAGQYRTKDDGVRDQIQATMGQLCGPWIPDRPL